MGSPLFPVMANFYMEVFEDEELMIFLIGSGDSDQIRMID
jgi:hypothetical protein